MLWLIYALLTQSKILFKNIFWSLECICSEQPVLAGMILKFCSSLHMNLIFKTCQKLYLTKQTLEILCIEFLKGAEHAAILPPFFPLVRVVCMCCVQHATCLLMSNPVPSAAALHSSAWLYVPEKKEARKIMHECWEYYRLHTNFHCSLKISKNAAAWVLLWKCNYCYVLTNRAKKCLTNRASYTALSKLQ